MSAAADQRLQSDSVFRTVDAAIFETVLSNSKLVRYRRGDNLFIEGDTCDLLWLVSTGWIRHYRVTRRGDEKVLGYRTTGHLVGESALLGRPVHGLSAQVYTDAELWVVDRGQLLTLLDRQPALLREFLKGLALEVDRCRQDLLDASSFDVRTRVLSALVNLAQRHGQIEADDTCRIRLPMSQQELASLVGTTRVTVSRICTTLPQVRFDQRSLTIQGWSEFEAVHG